jgi:hypothetical protein
LLDFGEPIYQDTDTEFIINTGIYSENVKESDTDSIILENITTIKEHTNYIINSENYYINAENSIITKDI